MSCPTPFPGSARGGVMSRMPQQLNRLVLDLVLPR